MDMYTNIKGTQIVERTIEVSESEILRALENILGTSDLVYNEDMGCVGFWVDVSSDRSNFEDWQFKEISSDIKDIQLVQSMEIIRERMK